MKILTLEEWKAVQRLKLIADGQQLKSRGCFKPYFFITLPNLDRFMTHLQLKL